jgi:hypothetical protein
MCRVRLASPPLASRLVATRNQSFVWFGVTRVEGTGVKQLSEREHEEEVPWPST